MTDEERLLAELREHKRHGSGKGNWEVKTKGDKLIIIIEAGKSWQYEIKKANPEDI